MCEALPPFSSCTLWHDITHRHIYLSGFLGEEGKYRFSSCTYAFNNLISILILFTQDNVTECTFAYLFQSLSEFFAQCLLM
jgi:hypothetical protein